jgi:hypothetical protein
MLEDRFVPSTLTVTNTLDSGAGSLRADIAPAHKGDTIVFNIPKSDPGYNAGTGVWTITLTSGELDITKNLTITGPGAANLTISGNHASRVFELSSHTKPQVSLSGLTISNGLVANNSGAGIDNYGVLTISNTTLSNNSAYDAGAIYNEYGATLTVNGCTLSGNSANLVGGAIANDGTATISNTTLSNNSAASSGGGIFNNGSGTLIVTGSTLSGNSAGGSVFGGVGGGIDSRGALTVSGCALSGNSAAEGGGICVAFNGTYSTATLTNDTVTTNTARNYVGGGLFIASGVTVSLDSFTVANILNNTDSSGLNGPTANIDGSYTLR